MPLAIKVRNSAEANSPFRRRTSEAIIAYQFLSVLLEDNSHSSEEHYDSV